MVYAPAVELAKSRWDYRSHDFIRDMSQAENNFQELYRRRPVDGKVKHLWDPREFGGRSTELRAAHDVSRRRRRQIGDF